MHDQKFNNSIINPYIVGVPIDSSKDFYGRVDILKDISMHLNSTQQKVLVVYGQRRIGKTSILRQILNSSPASYIPIYIELSSALTKLKDFLQVMIREISQKIGIDEPINIDNIETYFLNEFLSNVNNIIKNRRLLLIIDEFDILGDPQFSPNSPLRNEVFQYVQRIFREERAIFFIFAVGRRIDELPDYFSSIFKDGVFIKISLLDRKEVQELITKPLVGIREYEAIAIDEIFKLTSGNPFLTQLMCYEIFNNMRKEGSRSVTANDVQNAVNGALQTGTGGLSWYFNFFPAAERFILSAIAEAAQENEKREVSHLKVLDLLQKHRIRLQSAELEQAPQRLLTWEILSITPKNNYRFTVELIRLYIIRNFPLNRAIYDNEFLDKRATRSYENAREAFYREEYDLAISDYKNAIKLNPYMTSAQLGLAEAYLSKSEFAEAINAYEKAFEIDPDNTRNDFIRARIKFGKFLKEQNQIDKAVREYRIILDVLDDKNEDAAKEWIGIKKDECRLQLQDGNWQSAYYTMTQTIKQFQKFGVNEKEFYNIWWDEAKKLEMIDRWWDVMSMYHFMIQRNFNKTEALKSVDRAKSLQIISEMKDDCVEMLEISESIDKAVTTPAWDDTYKFEIIENMEQNINAILPVPDKKQPSIILENPLINTMPSLAATYPPKVKKTIISTKNKIVLLSISAFLVILACIAFSYFFNRFVKSNFMDLNESAQNFIQYASLGILCLWSIVIYIQSIGKNIILHFLISISFYAIIIPVILFIAPILAHFISWGENIFPFLWLLFLAVLIYIGLKIFNFLNNFLVNK